VTEVTDGPQVAMQIVRRERAGRRLPGRPSLRVRPTIRYRVRRITSMPRRLSASLGAALAAVGITLGLAAALALHPAPAAAQTLRGSRTAVDRAYAYAKRRGLPFSRSRRDVERAARAGQLVRLGGSSSYRLRGVAHPYVRPQTRTVLAGLAARYRVACGERLVVTSAVRPTSLRLPNSAARSVHPTGLAVDLRAPQGRCRPWLRGELLGLERRGLIDATEERRPAHFHVIVFRAP
jgi:hypothetical protein